MGATDELHRVELGIGRKIRQAREQLGNTIVEVAQRSGFSPAYISQIERDLANPSLGALKRVTDAIGIPLGALFLEEGGNEQTPEHMDSQLSRVVRASKRKVIMYPGSQIRYQVLSPDLRHKLEAIWLQAPPGTGSGQEPYEHEGEEIGIVLKGLVECRVGSQTHTLGAGDAIYLASHVPHGWRNVGDEDVEMIWVGTPPTF